jgi:uncharacterized tellurite resistance protein B-like protein
MISALKALFEPVAQETEEERQHRLRLAAAALLIETARSDFSQDAEEQAALEPLLCRALELPRDEVHGLIEAAEARVDQATSLYEFTRVINDHYSAQQKRRLIEAMWAVAYLDGNVHRYEEHLIRRTAELTYVPHGDYIAAKLKARENVAADKD